MPVGRLDIAVLIRTAGVRAFRFAVVVVHQCRVPIGQRPTAGVVAHRRTQRVRAMSLGSSTKLMKRLLDAGAEGFE